MAKLDTGYTVAYCYEDLEGDEVTLTLKLGFKPKEAELVYRLLDTLASNPEKYQGGLYEIDWQSLFDICLEFQETLEENGFDFASSTDAERADFIKDFVGEITELEGGEFFVPIKIVKVFYKSESTGELETIEYEE